MTPLVKVFQLLNSATNYAVLRNFDFLPLNYSRDIDIIINREDFYNIRHQIISVFEKSDYKLLQYYKGSEMHSLVFVEAKPPYDIISFDFLFSIYVKDTILLSSVDVLKSKIYNGKVYHVRKDMEFLSKYLYNILLNELYPDKYKHIKSEALQHYGQEIATRLAELDIDNSTSLNHVRYIQYKRHFSQMLSAQFRYLAATISNFIHPQGISISFTGPDGVGKTTIINNIVEILEKLYKDIPIYHFRPTILGNLGEVAHKAGLKKNIDREYNKPHRGEKTNVISSILRLLYYSLDYVVGYHRKQKYQIFQRKIVVYDRYFTDIICDGRRSRIFLKHKFLYWWGKLFIPSLDYNILLTASAETILSRKQELDAESITSINKKIDYLASKKGYTKILNDTIPQNAVEKILSYIFEQQHKKNLLRLKL